MLLLAGLVFGGALFSQAQKEDGEPKKPVDIRADLASRSPELPEGALVMTGNVVFHHNGAVISCDSAVRYSDRHIDCYRNVIINKDSTFVYGDRAEYNGEMNLARVYSPVIKVVDGDATLYTYNFTFNTSDNVGTWYGGGVLYQQDNVLESEKGYFYSDLHELVAVRDVEMKNDSHQITSDSVRYNTETRVASFYTRTYIWTREGEMVRAERGRYNTRDSTYFFYDNSYILTDFRETWADTIDFNARFENALLYGNIQIDDREHDSSAFGDFGQYWGERGETMLTERPSLLNYNEDQGNRDTLYMRADTVFMYVIYPSAGHRRDSLAESGAGSGDLDTPDTNARLQWADTLPDSVRLNIADSLKPVILCLRGEITTLQSRYDSIMEALYPSTAAGHGPDTVPEFDTVPPDVLDLPAIDSLLPAPPPVPEPEKDVPLEAIELRTRVVELTAEADSLQNVENYMRRQAPEVASSLDSLTRARIDSLAGTDSLSRADSLLRADPKAFKKYEKAARRAEKQRLREQRRIAKDAFRAEKLAAKAEKRTMKLAASNERRRLAQAKRGRIIDAALPDSIAIIDSLRRLDSLMPRRLDSLEILPHADSLSEPAAQPDTTIRIFRGWYDVKLWRRDMQGVCDSMVGFSVDSTIHMYTDPLLWHSNSQILADSITLFTAGEAVEHAEFFGDPIMGSKLGELSSKQFNQVKGRTMTSWFRDNAVYRHDADGNAQALYYMQDDEDLDGDGLADDPTPMAFLVASGASIRFYIADQFVDYISVREGTEWTAYPMDQIPPSQTMELQGFKWQEERQPTLKDVFDRRVRPTERVFHEALPHPEFPIAARIDRRREYLIKNRMWGDRTDPLPAHAIEFRRQKTGQ